MIIPAAPAEMTYDETLENAVEYVNAIKDADLESFIKSLDVEVNTKKMTNTST